MAIATQNSSSSYYSSINFVIPQTPDPSLPAAVQNSFQQVYNAMQQVIQALVNNAGINSQPPAQWSQFAGNPSTVLQNNMGRFYVTATEQLAYGAMISLTTNGTLIEAQNANATDNTRPAHGFCNVVGGIAPGVVGEVILGSGIVQISGLTIGKQYWLSGANGLVQATKPGVGGSIAQFIGFAIATNQLFCNIGRWDQN